ncbi:estradiol 17-beta-dehydrogenase 11-like isoform X1 [Uranotaenia lowii]|uniref:estradiol 17-beta-dehydrogenase 11-like isoform X1 n=1 Tax=Uranotaenia lowii TaxID=190385 RepID=UPI00247A2661|nr:estradiol 17-beta-dehydrogenase 11-like isoform X1 [Uranotaenia lowii]
MSLRSGVAVSWSMKQADTRSAGSASGKSLHLERLFMILTVVIDFVKVVILSGPILGRKLYQLIVPKDPRNVKGQLALITGGGNGLGKQMATELANRGCNLVIVDIDLAAAESTCEDLRKHNVSAHPFRVDVSSFADVQNLADTIYRDVGPIDILINNAGLVQFKPLQETSPSEIDRIIDVNVKSNVWMTKVFLEKMIENKRGHIVAISSMSGMYAFPWAVIYSTSKYAVNGFMSALTEQLRLQGHSKYIRTTCVCPYYIATRKDIVDFLKKPRFEILTTERTAQVIVEGILQNKDFIAIPPFFEIGVKIMQLFPLRVQQLVRDYIIREYDLNSSN